MKFRGSRRGKRKVARLFGEMFLVQQGRDEIGTDFCTSLDDNIGDEFCCFVNKPPNAVLMY